MIPTWRLKSFSSKNKIITTPAIEIHFLFLPGFDDEDKLFFSDAVVLSCLFPPPPCFRLLVDASDESDPDESDSEPLEPDESELELLRFCSLRRDPELCGFLTAPAAVLRDSTTAAAAGGGGELAFLRFSAFDDNGFERFSIENEIGLAARFSGGGAGARLLSGEGRRTIKKLISKPIL